MRRKADKVKSALHEKAAVVLLEALPPKMVKTEKDE